ncbi:BQ2448_5514 [Microbotryum intermedium]|uniref:BQ2448_5514 protein n=1 Tax=Microbotryum intermedium TaxID=269621 RepID=A0A238F7B3_9BASI|nr:BQ2448_5514 [Microbotryum intermedium]
MLSSKSRKANELVSSLDFSQSIGRDATAYVLGQLVEFSLGSELTAISFDPVQGLLAVATERGALHVFGKPSVHLSWDLGRPVKIKHLAFRPGAGFLACVDSKDTLHVFDLGRIENNKPYRDSSLSLRAQITCIEASPNHPHLFLGGKDGTVDIFDIDRGVLVPTSRIPNCWVQQEEILRRSGVPDAPSRRHIPVCTDVKTHPINLNLVLIAYDGGVSLFNLAQKRIERNWECECLWASGRDGPRAHSEHVPILVVIPPGAVGGGNDTEDTIFSERRPPVTCLAWRPDGEFSMLSKKTFETHSLSFLTGLMFAAGHEDGCISFACVSDDNPITIRTIERDAVNKTTEEDLFAWNAKSAEARRQTACREPIFRLAWSSFEQETMLSRATASFSGAAAAAMSSSEIPDLPTPDSPYTKGETMLTILGGLLPKDPPGIHVLAFPPYVAPPIAASASSNIPFAVREALKASIEPTFHHIYPTDTPPEDFVLLPRSSPHFSLSHDPTAMIITTGQDRRLPVLAAPHASRGIEAWSFPPAQGHPRPRQLRLPAQLSWNGPGTCVSARLLNVQTLAYRRMLHQFDMQDEDSDRIPLKGGKAYPRLRPSRTGLRNRIPLDNQPRIIVSSHVDLVVRFFDVSSSLLQADRNDIPSSYYSTTPAATVAETKPLLTREYPRPLAHLDFDIKDVLLDPSASALEASRILKERPWELEIIKCDFAVHTCELAVGLSTGEIILARLNYGDLRDLSTIEHDRAGAEAELDETISDALNDMNVNSVEAISNPDPQRRASIEPTPSHLRKGSVASTSYPAPSRDLSDHFIDLSVVLTRRPDRDGFRAVGAFLLPPPNSLNAPFCVELADIGFLAASSGNILLIADLRGPEVLLYDDPTILSYGKKGKSKAKPDASSVTSLRWTVTAIGDDHDRQPRLIATQASGTIRVFEMANVAGGWIVSEGPISFQHDSAKNTIASFVLDPLGNELLADPLRLQQAMDQQFAPSHENGGFSSLWVAVAPTLISAYFNINGPRTAQYEGDNASAFESASVVLKDGFPVLIATTRLRTIVAFALPSLAQITRMSFEAAIHSDVGTLSIASDGDLLQFIDPLHIRLHTIADIGRPSCPPNLELWDPTIPVPALTNALVGAASNLSSYLFGFQKKVYSGSDMDTIREFMLEGCISYSLMRLTLSSHASSSVGGPNRKPAPVRHRSAATSLLNTTNPPTPSRPAPSQPRTSSTQSELTTTQSILASTTEALERRGEYMSALQERLGTMANDAAKFAADTKKMAQQEAAKGSIKSGFTSLFNR